jgi:hypothetical protein
VDLGQYPKEKSDTVTVLEKIGHFLDDEVQRLHTWYKPDGYTNQEDQQPDFRKPRYAAPAAPRQQKI